MAFITISRNYSNILAVKLILHHLILSVLRLDLYLNDEELAAVKSIFFIWSLLEPHKLYKVSE